MNRLSPVAWTVEALSATMTYMWGTVCNARGIRVENTWAGAENSGSNDITWGFTRSRAAAMSLAAASP